MAEASVLTAALLGLTIAAPPRVIHVRSEPTPPAASDVARRPLHPMDAALPERPAASLSPAPTTTRRELGTPTTLYVNFDGTDLTECDKSNSKLDCHWYNNDEAFPPFSGTIQTKVSILQAMRRDASEHGIRITGVRPADDEDYTMVVYGGTEQDYGALGSAPSGDCGDQLPNQIVFAHVDGELNEWVNGGATTALHEAAHSWGLDHVDADPSIMFPAGTNAEISFSHSCAGVVKNTDLEPGDAACPEINELLCGDPNLQDAPAVLTHLFGPSYADTTPPAISLIEPADGQYFQAPANFDVVLGLEDDLHPQLYSMAAWVGDDDPPEQPSPLIEPGFAVSELPIGEWQFHVIITDEAGNASEIEFNVVVGEDPPPEPVEEGCACRSGTPTQPAVPAFVVMLLAGARRRKTR